MPASPGALLPAPTSGPSGSASGQARSLHPTCIFYTPSGCTSRLVFPPLIVRCGEEAADGFVPCVIRCPAQGSAQ